MDAGHTPDEADAEDPSTMRFSDRLRKAFLKPAKPGAELPIAELQSVEELEAAVSSVSDKERLVGLLAAPLAAAIGILVVASQIKNNPSALLPNGAPNPRHTSVALYEELVGVLIGLSILMIVLSLLRKRLFLGIVMALFGLAVFNLHFWGFGVPFVMAGAWLLVRAYRLQRALREAGGGAARLGDQYRNGSRSTAGPSRPHANKRYTPRRR